jgi:hypothetical protein
MKNHKKIILQILIEEFSKINNVNYYFRYENLSIKVNTKQLILGLINECDHFEAGIKTDSRIDYLKGTYFWLSYRHIWSKLEEATNLDYGEIQKVLTEVLIESFQLKKMPIMRTRYQGKVNNLHRNFDQLHGFKFKDLSISKHSLRSTTYMRDGFELKGVK